MVMSVLTELGAASGLLTTVGDREFDVCSSACRALANMAEHGDTPDGVLLAGVPVLAKAMRHGDQGVRASAAVALGALGMRTEPGFRAVQETYGLGRMVQRVSSDQSTSVRVALAGAIGQLATGLGSQAVTAGHADRSVSRPGSLDLVSRPRWPCTCLRSRSKSSMMMPPDDQHQSGRLVGVASEAAVALHRLATPQTADEPAEEPAEVLAGGSTEGSGGGVSTEVSAEGGKRTVRFDLPGSIDGSTDGGDDGGDEHEHTFTPVVVVPGTNAAVDALLQVTPWPWPEAILSAPLLTVATLACCSWSGTTCRWCGRRRRRRSR